MREERGDIGGKKTTVSRREDGGNRKYMEARKGIGVGKERVQRSREGVRAKSEIMGNEEER